MNKLRRFIRISLVPMIFVLPLWITIGRSLFGVGGWDVLFTFFIVAPILLISMLVIGLLISGRSDVKASGLVSPLDARLLTALYLSIFIFGFFLVGGGDTEESVKSVATQLLGGQFLDASQSISEWSLWLASALLPACVVVASVERFRAPATPRNTQ
jgi:hypothetical protein